MELTKSSTTLMNKAVNNSTPKNLSKKGRTRFQAVKEMVAPLKPTIRAEQPYNDHSIMLSRLSDSEFLEEPIPLNIFGRICFCLILFFGACWCGRAQFIILQQQLTPSPL